MTAPELAPGDVVAGRDSYTIARSLGRSEHAVTYSATTPAGREVVLKVYDPGLDEEAKAAIRRAATITADLPRSAALLVLEVGNVPGTDSLFVATEPSARPPLAQLVALCPLTPLEAAALARSLARALGEAHERGLMHLALRPDSVFVGPVPRCEVTLGDFASPPATLWMAPERTVGGWSVGPAADVFSAALVVFYALTGQTYWRAAAPGQAASSWWHEVLGEQVPASTRAAELGRTLDPAWDPPFARALRFEPAGRFKSVGELADAFALAARGVMPPPVTEPEAPTLELRIVPDAPTLEIRTAPAAVPAARAQDVLDDASTSRWPSTVSPAPQPAARSWRANAPWLAAGVAAWASVAVVSVLIVKAATSQPTATSPSVGAPSATTAAPPPPASATAPSLPPPQAPVAPPAPAPADTTPTPAPAPSSSPQVDSFHSLLVVTCTPSCDSVYVDGHPVAHPDQGKLLPPGVHQVGANLAHHPSHIQPILLRRGHVEHLDVVF